MLRYKKKLTKKRLGRNKKRFTRHINHRGGSVSNPNDLKFGIMAIFKNEAMGIREWVEHYKWQGADEILLLDNNSTDNGADLIKGIPHVTVVNAPKSHAQKEQYNTIGMPWLKEKKIDIIAIVDLDEFMFGKEGKKLKERVLEVFTRENRPSQFSCQWTMFGSSGISTQPKSIRKSFIHRKRDLDPNIKSVMWVKDVEENGLNLHVSKVKGETVTCPANIQLNHYAIQSKEYFEKVKMKRGDASNPLTDKVRDWNYFEKYDHNDLEDRQLLKMVEAQT
jgi:hypothetical protein